MESRYIYTCVAALNVILRHVFIVQMVCAKCADGLHRMGKRLAQGVRTVSAQLVLSLMVYETPHCNMQSGVNHIFIYACQCVT